MALGAVDGGAVVKSSDGKMQVLKTRDEIPGTQAVITQVLPDRLIVEETTATRTFFESGTISSRIGWGKQLCQCGLQHAATME